MTHTLFEILGGKVLNGVIEPGGSKNATFPILAATILCSKPILIKKVPNIIDIEQFLLILKELGANIQYLERNSILIDPTTINCTDVPEELGGKIRGSYYFLGALLGKFGSATIGQPGGCNIGNRPIDLHLQTLSRLGNAVLLDEKTGKISAKREKSIGKSYTIELPFPSRGATINILLAAALLEGIKVQIKNANTSPEAVCLQEFLIQAGISIKNAGTSLIEIQGVSSVDLREYTIIPDKIEIGTLVCSSLITGGWIKIENIIVEHITPFLNKLIEMGYEPLIDYENKSIEIYNQGNIRPSNVISGLTAPYIDADWEPPLAALLCTLPGQSIIQDKINPERHSRYIPELIKLGANIEIIDDQTARILGGAIFKPSDVMCQEIRGGAAITIAALSANGKSIIRNVQQIDRGYESFELKLQSLGANIYRKSYEK